MSKDNFEIINARFTFKNVPIHQLERFQFDDVTSACDAFKKLPGVSECVIIQTASRVEVINVINLETGDSPDARRIEGRGLILNKIKETWESLKEFNQYELDHFDQTLEVYKNDDVYHHLLRLTCGLDSVVVGKDEILDEIKSSILNAKESGTSGNILNKLFDTVIRVATRIRDSTGISKEAKSLGDSAVKLVEEKTGIDSKKKVLLIGTGETAAMVAKSLNQKEYEFSVTSMTIDRSIGFSKILGGTTIEFEEVISGFDKFDIIFVATTADYFLISYDKLKRVMEKKKKGTIILDISDPRAVSDDIAMFPGMKLMFRDQISEMDEESVVKARKNKISATEKAIDIEVPIIAASMKRISPTIVKDVAETVDSLRQKELEKALEKLGETDKNKIKIIEELTKSVAESIISVPVTSPKKDEQKNSD